MKVIASYQQTFGTSFNVTSQNFKFQRVYKSNPDYKIRITVGSTSLFQRASGSSVINAEPRVLLLSGIPEINGKCNYQTVGDDNSVTNTNEYVLGIFAEVQTASFSSAKASTHTPISTSFVLNDLPLGDFTIRYEDIQGPSALLPPALFAVTFLIDVVEM